MKTGHFLLTVSFKPHILKFNAVRLMNWKQYGKMLYYSWTYIDSSVWGLHTILNSGVFKSCSLKLKWKKHFQSEVLCVIRRVTNFFSSSVIEEVCVKMELPSTKSLKDYNKDSIVTKLQRNMQHTRKYTLLLSVAQVLAYCYSTVSQIWMQVHWYPDRIVQS